MRPYDEAKMREMIREEVKRVLTEGGITLKEGRGKKGSRVRTVHGVGTILSCNGDQVNVALDSGATMKVHRDRATVVG